MRRAAATRLSALDPGKQGLKLAKAIKDGLLIALSALDPGKQGLKHSNALRTI